jgi:hypothetical protein
MTVLEPTDRSETLKRVRDRIRSNLARAAGGIIEAGKDLLHVKEALPHGQFNRWVMEELGISDRTAERFMTVARRFDGKPDGVAVLPPGVLYELSAPSTPDDVVAGVLDGRISPTVAAIAAAKANRPTMAPPASRGRLASSFTRTAIALLESDESAEDLAIFVWNHDQEELVPLLYEMLKETGAILQRWTHEEQKFVVPDVSLLQTLIKGLTSSSK